MELYKNIKWVGENTGEIDLVVTKKDKMNEVIALVECKTNILDIASGYRQSGNERNQLKTSIKIKRQIIPVASDIPCFVFL